MPPLQALMLKCNLKLVDLTIFLRGDGTMQRRQSGRDALAAQKHVVQVAAPDGWREDVDGKHPMTGWKRVCNSCGWTRGPRG